MSKRAQPSTPFTQTLPQQIRHVLARVPATKTHPAHELHVGQLAKKLPYPKAKIAEACNRMNHRGELTWVKLGTYRLNLKELPLL